MIAMTFLDGFSPLDGLWGRTVRPGSDENLIDISSYELPEGAPEIIADLHQRAAATLREALLQKAESLVEPQMFYCAVVLICIGAFWP